jgi:hypothetical protein
MIGIKEKDDLNHFENRAVLLFKFDMDETESKFSTPFLIQFAFITSFPNGL